MTPKKRNRRPRNEQAILGAARKRGILLEAMSEYWLVSDRHPPTLLIGYGQPPAPTISVGVAELGAAIRESRSSTKRR